MPPDFYKEDIMASKKPIVRQTAWLSMLPHLAVIVLLLIFYLLTVKSYYPALLLAIISYGFFCFDARTA